jgi:hypothetical protein
MLDKEGHKVTALDNDAYSFRRLPPDFGGTALIGNGLDEEALKKAGIEKADAFVAVTQCPRWSAEYTTPCAATSTASWGWRPLARPRYSPRC